MFYLLFLIGCETDKVFIFNIGGGIGIFGIDVIINFL